TRAIFAEGAALFGSSTRATGDGASGEPRFQCRIWARDLHLREAGSNHSDWRIGEIAILLPHLPRPYPGGALRQRSNFLAELSLRCLQGLLIQIRQYQTGFPLLLASRCA